MFAPHTTHFSRTLPSHAHPTTRRKLQVQDENNKLPRKTPSRSNLTGKGAVLGLGNTGGPATRLGLGAKTEGRDRNVLKGEGSGGKGKGKEGDDIAPKRLFANPKLAPSTSFSSFQPIVHPKTHHRSGSTFGPGPSGSNFTPKVRPAHGPSKTPARAPPTARKANLRTPAPGLSAFRIARDSLPDADAPSVPPVPEAPAVLSTPLASAQRDRKRRSMTGRSSLSLSGPHRLSGSGSGPGSMQKQQVQKEVVYKTPAPARRYQRDAAEGEEGEGEGEGDSMDSIQLAPDLRASVGGMVHGAEVGLDVLDEHEEEEEGSDDEVEYMPPKPSITWDRNADIPEFTLKDHFGPDYEAILADGHWYGEGPVTPPLDGFDSPDFDEVSLCRISDEDLEDPLFRFVPSLDSDALRSGADEQGSVNKVGPVQARAGGGTGKATTIRAGPHESSIPQARAAVRSTGNGSDKSIPGMTRAPRSGVRFAAPPEAPTNAKPTTAKATLTTASAAGATAAEQRASSARLARTARTAPDPAAAAAAGNAGNASTSMAQEKLKPRLPAAAVTRKPAAPAAAAPAAQARQTFTSARNGPATTTTGSKAPIIPATSGHGQGPSRIRPAPSARGPAAGAANNRSTAGAVRGQEAQKKGETKEEEEDDEIAADLQLLAADEPVLDMGHFDAFAADVNAEEDDEAVGVDTENGEDS